MKPYLLVSGDFVQTGGMDRANYALARHLAERGVETHLVAHRVADSLLRRPNVVFHRVPKLLNSYTLSEALLDRVGRRWGARIAARGGRVVVNGGNCNWGDVNWVHYVHAAYREPSAATLALRMRRRLQLRLSLSREAHATRAARFIVANSHRTRADLVQRLGVPARRAKAVYYGIDRELFRPSNAEEKAHARRRLSWPAERPVLVFVGALGDRRKGFDTLFEAWSELCEDPRWPGLLAVVGSGAELPLWKARAESANMARRIVFLGPRNDVPVILAGADALVAPTRYEAYGLAVHEALCCGLPAFVTRNAGVAEQYPSTLQALLLADPDDAKGLAVRLRSWLEQRGTLQPEIAALGARLRERTWDDMAEEILGFVDGE